MPSTRIDLLRHGESMMNLHPTEVVGGRSNHTPLTPTGTATALRYGKQLARNGRPDAVYATRAIRSQQTAALLIQGAGWGLPVALEDGLLELSQGIAEGQPRAHWWTPAAQAAMRANPLGHRLAPRGETHREVQVRMRSALQRLATRHKGGYVLAVGHGVAIRSLIWSMNGGGHEVFRGLDLPNLAMTSFVVDGDRIQLMTPDRADRGVSSGT